jgi:predicted dinucleotide-binding enzyme
MVQCAMRAGRHRRAARPARCLFAADDEARDAAEQLIRDAGYEPEGLGGLDNARALEDFVLNVFIKLAPTFYRFAPPGEL